MNIKTNEDDQAFILQIGWPDALTARSDFEDVRLFLQNTETEVKKLGGKIVFLPHANPPWTSKGFSLNFHGHGSAPNTYFYKESFLKGWIQIDTNGHSGYFSRNNFDVVSNHIPRFNLVDRLTAYIADGASKYEQPKCQNNSLTRDFVFFPLQKPQDETNLFQNIGIERAINDISRWCKNNNLSLVIKRHPFDHSNVVEECLQKLAGNTVCEIIDGDVTDLINRSKLVVTFNSSVGFEALIRGCPVVSLAPSEYSEYTYNSFQPNEIHDALSKAFNSSEWQHNSLNSRIKLQLISQELASNTLFEATSKEDVVDFIQFAIRRMAYSASIDSRIGKLNAEIGFSEASNSDHYKLNGFSYAEDWGSWSTDDYCSILLENPTKNTHQYELTIKVRGYVHDIWPLSRFKLFINRQESGLFEVRAGDGDKEFTVAAFLNPGLNTITIQNLDLVRPIDLGIDFDTRKLGIGLISMQFS